MFSHAFRRTGFNTRSWQSRLKSLSLCNFGDRYRTLYDGHLWLMLPVTHTITRGSLTFPAGACEVTLVGHLRRFKCQNAGLWLCPKQTCCTTYVPTNGNSLILHVYPRCREGRVTFPGTSWSSRQMLKWKRKLNFPWSDSISHILSRY
jgi:hypothetical protein